MYIFNISKCYPKGFQRVCNESRYLNQCDKNGKANSVINYSENRCAGVECFCDNECAKGLICKNQNCAVKQSGCSEVSTTCKLDFVKNIIEANSKKETKNRCKGVTCRCDSDCESRFCN